MIRNRTALFFAASLEAAAALLELRANPNHMDDHAQTALYYLAKDGCTSTLQRLLTARADAVHRDVNGQTALSYAARGGHSECLGALLEARAAPGAQDINGLTPLNYAASGGHFQACQLLVDSRADPRAALKALAKGQRLLAAARLPPMSLEMLQFMKELGSAGAGGAGRAAGATAGATGARPPASTSSCARSPVSADGRRAPPLTRRRKLNFFIATEANASPKRVATAAALKEPATLQLVPSQPTLQAGSAPAAEAAAVSSTAAAGCGGDALAEASKVDSTADQAEFTQDDLSPAPIKRRRSQKGPWMPQTTHTKAHHAVDGILLPPTPADRPCELKGQAAMMDVAPAEDSEEFADEIFDSTFLEKTFLPRIKGWECSAEYVSRVCKAEPSVVHIQDKKYCRTALFAATEAGHAAVVKTLLEYRAEANSPDMYGQTPLFHASGVHSSETECAKLLLQYRASAEYLDRNEQTPLFYAAGAGAIEPTRLILNARANVNHQDHAGRCALLYAVKECRPKIVRMLIMDFQAWWPGGDETASWWPEDEGCRDIYQMAIERGLRELVEDLRIAEMHWEAHQALVSRFMASATSGTEEDLESLLGHKADVNHVDAKGRTAIHCAAGRTDGRGADILRFLASRNATVHVTDRDGRAPLHYAAISGDADTVRALTLCGTIHPGHADASGDTPLLEAAQLGHEAVVAEILQFVLFEKDSVLDHQNTSGLTALACAARCGHPEVVRKLLEALADPSLRDTEGQTPLIIAKGAECVELLLQSDCDPLATNIRQESALLHQSIKGDVASVHLLLDAGASPVLQKKRTTTPLHAAANAEVAKLLLEAQADVYATDVALKTPLLSATLRGDLRLVSLLLEAKSEVNARDSKGRSALMVAVQLRLPSESTLQLAEQLVKARADLKLRNGKKQRACDLAMKAGNAHAAAYLQRAMVEQLEALADADGASSAAASGTIGVKRHAPPKPKAKLIQLVPRRVLTRNATAAAARKHAELLSRSSPAASAADGALVAAAGTSSADASPPVPAPRAEGAAGASSEVPAWLERERFGNYAPAFLNAGYDDLYTIANLSEREVDEMLDAVGAKARTTDRVCLRDAVSKLKTGNPALG
eukprot:TRINITY_DN18389_c0_g1_i1.p1 TRINITY_DN18389_c0_g1~~TRINITY_DN18389_c0_g1_i1.p1  ORF type:complete len:1232 (+),score=271.25 TRINITY_DN18389_c0_g1_i1:358-3696(+)